MRATRVVITDEAILNGMEANVAVVLSTIGNMTHDQARVSMKPHLVATTRKKTGGTKVKYVGQTPKGEPPRIRKGLIVNNIQVAQQDGAVFIGPIKLAGHRTECLARLEYGDHPFMQPALNAVIPKLPEVWQNSIIQ